MAGSGAGVASDEEEQSSFGVELTDAGESKIAVINESKNHKMKHIKLFEQFISESNQTNIVNVILDSLEPTIVEMVAATETWFIKTFEREFTKYDREFARINLTFDMIKAVENYTQPTDSLLSINVSKSNKGNIEINAQIQRDGITYPFSTEAIYAGGHNIQRLHYRYITKTSIPKTGETRITKEYTDRIKKMSKAEKLNNEIKNYEKRIENNNDLISKSINVSDTEIIKIIKADSKYEINPSWEEIVKRGAAKNYDNDESFYNSEMAK